MQEKEGSTRHISVMHELLNLNYFAPRPRITQIKYGSNRRSIFPHPILDFTPPTCVGRRGVSLVLLYMIMSLFLITVAVYHIQIARQYFMFFPAHWLLGLLCRSRAAVSHA